MMRLNERILIPVGILSALALAVAVLATPMTGTYAIESFAGVQTPPEVEVYRDVTGLEDVTEIGWGELKPGETKTVTVYVKNAGGSTFTASMSTEDWNPPEAGDFITLDWDFGSNPLKTERIRTTRLTLRVDSEISGITNFNFTIIITASEVMS